MAHGPLSHKTHYKLKLHTKPKQTEQICKPEMEEGEEERKKNHSEQHQNYYLFQKLWHVANGSDHIGFMHAETIYVLCSIWFKMMNTLSTKH